MWSISILYGATVDVAFSDSFVCANVKLLQPKVMVAQQLQLSHL